MQMVNISVHSRTTSELIRRIVVGHLVLAFAILSLADYQRRCLMGGYRSTGLSVTVDANGWALYYMCYGFLGLWGIPEVPRFGY
jgi:hypothetical protein